MTLIEILAGTHDGKAPSRLLLFEEGDQDITGWDGKTLTADGVNNMLDAFEARGVDVPIDYEHTSVPRRTKAIAAGWVTDLEFVPGEGLYADVRWTEQARQEIESTAYKYWSPVALFDEESGEFSELHSVALTNRPATLRQPELLAASTDAVASLRELLMATKAKTVPVTKKRRRRRATSKQSDDGDTRSAADEVLPGVDVDTEALPDEQVSDLADTGDAMTMLKEALIAAGAEIGDDATAADIAAMAIEFVAGASASADEGDTEAASEEDKGKEALAAVNAAKAARVPTLEKRLALLEASQKTQRVEALIAKQVEAHKLLPDDDQQMKTARRLAELDEDLFVATYDGMEPYVDVGQVTPEGGGTPANARARVIKEACRQHDDNAADARGTSKKHYVNASLQCEDEPHLTSDEVTALEGVK